MHGGDERGLTAMQQGKYADNADAQSLQGGIAPVNESLCHNGGTRYCEGR